MNRQRVKFSVSFPDFHYLRSWPLRSEDVWIGGRVDALSGVEAIERATKQAWPLWLWECSGDFPIRAIATDPAGREWSGVVSLGDPAIRRRDPFHRHDVAPRDRLIPMPAFAVELD